MKNNIKKAPAKFWEDMLYFQHFMQIFVFAPTQRLLLIWGKDKISIKC